ncbi:M81 family metallopeptidase [Actinomycetaceae bacterium TAE3-ERU4]|nr:M81 family metallopeptidase [Actinomycetaceae bacterium TAE3-ERU4]
MEKNYTQSLSRFTTTQRTSTNRGRLLRIAAGGIHIESSTFTPYISGEADFRVTRGDDLKARYPWFTSASDTSGGYDLPSPTPHTFPSQMPPLEGVELIPLVHAGALPGGPVDSTFFANWLKEFSEGLEKAAQKGVDGLLLDIHGAMAVPGIDDPEGLIAERARRILGSKAIISAAMDLHGNISEDLFRACDLLTCYRTAPHIDQVPTRYRASANLVRALRYPTPIYRARVAVPILLSGEQTSTRVEPGKSLYESLEPACVAGRVWDAAIWMGFPWADQPRCHGVVVTCGSEREEVSKVAQEIAEKYWGYVNEFDFVGPTAEPQEAIKRAYDSEDSPFFLSDTGDNPGAGGSDDTVGFLGEMLAQYRERNSQKSILFTSIFDPETVLEAQNYGPDKELKVRLGAKVGAETRQDVALTDTFFTEKLFSSSYGGNSVLLRSGNFRIVVTSERTQYCTEEAFRLAGFPNFSGLDVVAVKIGYLEPDLFQAASGWVMALTPGAVDQDLIRVGHQRLKRPLFPFDLPSFHPNLEPWVESSAH